jgi:type II pantothenate kinase
MKIPQDILEKLSLAGNRKNLDSLIGEVVNDIGSLHPEVTASNFEKARYGDDHSDGDIAASYQIWLER